MFEYIQYLLRTISGALRGILNFSNLIEFKVLYSSFIFENVKLINFN